MTRVMQIDSVESTFIWRCLSKHPKIGAFPGFAANIAAICREASERMKAMSVYAPQFTLHDECHLLRTTELMAHIMGSMVDDLNPIELALLILAAFFHDQGMILSREEYGQLTNSPAFELYKDKWLVDHPNYSEIQKQLGISTISATERTNLAKKMSELDQALLTDFLRETHATRSAVLMRNSHDVDKRLEVLGVNLTQYAAQLCESHGLAVENLTPNNGFRFDEQIGTFSVNMPYLGIILRLADLLDFDRDRTPEVLLESIHFTSDVSLCEWEKHRCVQGWIISSERIRFSMRSRHPAYEAAARQYMDRIDLELAACHESCRSQPHYVARYKLNLPSQVDRSRIEPLDNRYRYHDLEFRLSRNEVVHLLMTDKLYNQPSLCIRELLQNALDALRYKRALFAAKGAKWNEGRVNVRHYVDATGYEVIECNDNGSGMDEDIIRNHFVKIGRSFYRSPEFEMERVGFRKSGVDFDPCSKFGIGFMSCFMLGDHITIRTRRDYGPSRDMGKSLIVEIQGLSGLLIVRDGASDQSVGTTVTIISRRKPSFLDEWTDEVRLTTILKGYALATEFPIIGRCEVPEISDSVTIPPEIEKPPTLLEKAGIKKAISFEQDLKEVDQCLNGIVRESFLIDSNGSPCVENDEARWCGTGPDSSRRWELQLVSDGRCVGERFRERSIPVCSDGILLAGLPGRPSYREEVHMLGWHNSFIESKASAVLDARGYLKPEMSPGRTMPESFSSRMERLPGWRRLGDYFNSGQGLLWDKLAAHLERGLTDREFWRLLTTHEMWALYLTSGTVWNSLSVSLVDAGGQSHWRKIRALGELLMNPDEEKKTFALCDANGDMIVNGRLEMYQKWARKVYHPGTTSLTA